MDSLTGTIRCVAAALAASCLFSVTAHADIVQWISQDRSVSASGEGLSDGASAPDFGPFTASASVVDPSDPNDPYSGGSAYATQDSQRLTGATEGFVASLSAAASSLAPGSDLGAMSDCVIHFELTEPSEFTFYANQFGTSQGVGDLAIAYLHGDGDAAVLMDTEHAPGPTRQVSGVLPAGIYQYYVSLGASAHLGPGNTWAETWLLIPEPPGLALLAGLLLYGVITRRVRRTAVRSR